MKKVLLFVVLLTLSSIIVGQNKIIIYNANLIDGISNVEKRNMMIFRSTAPSEWAFFRTRFQEIHVSF